MIQPEGEHLFTPCCSPGDSWACANRSESPEISFSSMEQGWFCRESAFDTSGWDLGSSHEGPPLPTAAGSSGKPCLLETALPSVATARRCSQDGASILGHLSVLEGRCWSCI